MRASGRAISDSESFASDVRPVLEPLGQPNEEQDDNHRTLSEWALGLTDGPGRVLGTRNRRETRESANAD
jgi:hypothetical protein